MKKFTVDRANEGQRLNKYIERILLAAPSSFVYKMLRKKNITLNSKKADGKEILKAGDEVVFFLSDETFDKFSQKEDQAASDNSQKVNVSSLKLEEIIFENEDILIIHKPVGELSQKANPEDISINERIRKYLENNNKDVSFNPGVCNRLDRNTEGLITAGKNLLGQVELSKMFRERTIEKYYIALVLGKVEKEIDAKAYLTKDHDKNLVTISDKYNPEAEIIHNHFKPIYTNGRVSLLKVKLLTGKSHQIRAHLAYLNHPILGDRKYKNDSLQFYNEKYKLKNQLLLAYELVFPKQLDKLQDLSGKAVKTRLPKQYLSIIEGEKLCPGNHVDLEVHF